MIEMMVVIVLVGLLAGMATTVWKSLAGRMKSRSDVEDLRKAILLAKSDAVTRNRHTGIYLDAANRKYLMFVDSSSTGSQDGQYLSGERILQGWRQMGSDTKIYSVASSLTPLPPIRKCGHSATGTSSSQSGFYSIVFRPDGSSWASLVLAAGNTSLPGDTTRLYVVQASGLVYKAKT